MKTHDLSFSLYSYLLEFEGVSDDGGVQGHQKPSATACQTQQTAFALWNLLVKSKRQWLVLGLQGKPLWTVLYSVPLLVSVLSGDMAQQAQASVMNKNNGLCVCLCAGAVRCHANASPGISVDVMLLSDIIFFSSI